MATGIMPRLSFSPSKVGTHNKLKNISFFVPFGRVPGRTYGLRRSVRAVNKLQERDKDQREYSPEDKPESLKDTQKAPPQQLTAPPTCQRPKEPYQPLSQTPLATARTESPTIRHPASNTGNPAVTPKSCLGLYSQLPLPGRSRAGGRLGVSFCFSRRGPRLEPSASVFSDLEEEEREKREQMKERIKGIMDDIYREMGDIEGRKHGESEKFKSGAEITGPSDAAPIPREAAEEEEIEKGDTVKEPFPVSKGAADNQSPDSLFRPAQTQMTIWGGALAGTHVDTEHTDSETEKRRESEETWEESRYMCVLGKDGSTGLRWPVSLVKFTKSQPHICYSCNPLCSNPQQTEHITEDGQAPPHNPSSALPDESGPRVLAILTSDAYSRSERQNRRALRVHGQVKVEENFKAGHPIDVERKEHLLFKDQNLLSSETTQDRKRCTLGMENCVKAASHPFDPAHIDSSNTNSQNPLGGRLGDTRGIREGAITALSCKSESVIQTGAQGLCISPSRCECGSETTCECASAPQPCTGVSGVSRKEKKASTKKHKQRKKRREGGKASNKQQSARRKVRSVVSTVSTGRVMRGEAGGSWEKKWRQEETGEMRRGKRRRRRVQSAGSSCLLGRCEAESVSVSVRKRRPRRSHSTESQSEADREQAEHCGAPPQLTRLVADRVAMREGRRDKDAVTFPWRSHFSLHSFSSGCNSKLFWERGHHSNPRSFIDCCYPDNSCGCSPARKRKLLHRDRIFIHRKRKSFRHRNVGEETERGRKTGGPWGCRDRGMISDTEEWEWSCPGGWRSRNKAPAWDRLAKFSPSPSSWGRGGRHLSRDDADWDRCSMDRWTWGSSDSWEDRGTHRSVSGCRTGADSRDSPDSVWKSAGASRSHSKNLSSPEWWTSRQTYSPLSVITTRASRGHSPRSCSPCSSTSMSELSWDCSRSSTCSGVTVGRLTVSSCKTSAPGVSSEGPHNAEKRCSPSPSGLNSSSVSSSSSPNRSSITSTVPGLNRRHVDANPQLKEAKSQSDLGPSASVTTSMSDASPGSSSRKSGPQKSARMLLLPLIGKLPAIQKKARRKKGLPEKIQEKDAEDEDEAKVKGGSPEAATNNQKCTDTAQSNPSSTPNLCPSETGTTDKRTVGATAPPISFTAEEMDKYRLLQEQAREHMQKVLEQTQESADTHAETNYTHTAQSDSRGTSEERYTPAPMHSATRPQTQTGHADSVQTQAQHTLQVSLPPPHVTAQENFTQPMALGVPNLPPLPSLHHIILQHTALPVPPSSVSSSTSPPSPAMHPHPAQLPHPLPPLHPSLSHHLQLSPISISSLFPSILVSHHPIPLLHQSPTFHATPLTPLSSVTLQPLNPQTFMDRAWPVRFQQKAL